MDKMSPDECFRVLELDVSASPDQVRAAFRRLAKKNHPDLSRGRSQQKRFEQIVDAYRILKNELKLHADGSDVRICPGCGQYKELLEGLDGRSRCPDCLLGETRRKRFLPQPVFTTAKHLLVVGLYVVAIVLMIQSFVTEDLVPAVWSFGCALAGLIILAVTVLRIRNVR
jgi:hypothetical protein